MQNFVRCVLLFDSSDRMRLFLTFPCKESTVLLKMHVCMLTARVWKYTARVCLQGKIDSRNILFWFCCLKSIALSITRTTIMANRAVFDLLESILGQKGELSKKRKGRETIFGTLLHSSRPDTSLPNFRFWEQSKRKPAATAARNFKDKLMRWCCEVSTFYCFILTYGGNRCLL